MGVVFLRHVPQQKIGQYHQRGIKKLLKGTDNVREIGREHTTFKYFYINDNEKMQHFKI